MKSFYEFYQKMLKEQAPMAGAPAVAQPIQGGQTSPSVPPNYMSDPKVSQAMQLLANTLGKDPKMKPAFDQFQKTITANTPQVQQVKPPQAQGQPQAQAQGQPQTQAQGQPQTQAQGQPQTQAQGQPQA